MLLEFHKIKSPADLAKRLCVVGLLFLSAISAYASGPFELYRKGLFALDIGAGCNIDLSSLNQEQKAAFEERPMTVFQVTMRPSYYFSRHWGAYADLRLNFFRLTDVERLLDVLMPGLSKLKPALSLGGTYRYDCGKWQLQPRLGLGIVNYGGKNSKSKKNGKETVTKRNGDMWCIDAGFSVAYRTSRVCSVFLDAGMMQPFTPAKYSKTTTIDGVVTGYKIDSRSWGRSMSLNIGVRLQTSGK